MALRNHFLISGLFGLIILFLAACNADELKFDNIAIPSLKGDFTLVLGETTYTIKELLEDLNDPNIDISEDAAGLLAVYYRDTTFFDDFTDFIDLGDVTNDGTLDPNVSLPASPKDSLLAISTIDLEFTYAAQDDEQLDSVIYSAGRITLDIQSNFDVDTDYILKINDIIDTTTGDSLTFTGSLFANGSDSKTANLAGQKTIMKRVGSSNVFGGTFDATLIVKTGDVITSDQNITYNITITDSEFSDIYGWFDSQTIEIQSQTIDVDFFEGIAEDGLVFGNPQIKFLIENSFGIPMGMLLDSISATNVDGKTQNLTGSVTEKPQTVRAPSIENVGSSLSSTVIINAENSNLRDLLSISPNVFNLTITGLSNYLNPDTDLPVEDQDTTRNFLTEAGKVDIITEISLPLDVKLAGFSRDFDTDISSFDFSDADTLSFILKSENDLPFNGMIDMQFLDEDSVVTFEFIDVLLLASPEVDGTDRTVEPAINTARIKVYMGNGFQELLDASTLKLVMKIDSYEADQDRFVKIYSDYQTVLKVSIQSNLNLEL